MPLENRKATCDICHHSEREERFGTGWPNWVIVQGIGAVAPKPDEPIDNKHTEMYICPTHKQDLAGVLNRMQEINK